MENNQAVSSHFQAHSGSPAEFSWLQGITCSVSEGKEQGQDESTRYHTACQTDQQPRLQGVCRLWQCCDDGPLGGFPIKGELFPCKHFYHFHHPCTDPPATARPPNPFSWLLTTKQVQMRYIFFFEGGGSHSHCVWALPSPLLSLPIACILTDPPAREISAPFTGLGGIPSTPHLQPHSAWPPRCWGTPALTHASHNRGSDACEESSAPCSRSIQPGDTFPAGTLVTQATPAPWQCAGRGLGLPENGRKARGSFPPRK